MINKIQTHFERQAFGVCQWWAGKLSIELSQVRLFFIYTSFMTLGSPLIIYLIMAFLLKHKHAIKGMGRKRVWDL